MNFYTETTIKLDSVNKILLEKGLLPNGATQKFFTNEIMRLADDYVPMNSGTLKNNVTMATDGTYYTYESIYAHYQWEGLLMVDPIYKIGAFYNDLYGFWSRAGVFKIYDPNGRKLNNATGIRGPHWVDRMWNYRGDEIILATQKFMEKR